jgi:hypothetical protein
VSRSSPHRCGALLLQLQEPPGQSDTFLGRVVSLSDVRGSTGFEGKVVPTAFMSTMKGKVMPTALGKPKGETRRCDDPVLELRESAVADKEVQIEVLPSSFQGMVVPTALGTAAKLTAVAAPSDAARSDEQDWLQRGAAAARGLLTKVKSNGKAGALSLVAETVVFWVAILIPASLVVFHQQTGAWAPDQSDPESWAAFTAILGSCYVFCKIPPIEAARWAWVIAWTPWMAENVLGEKPQADTKDVSAQAEGNL